MSNICDPMDCSRPSSSVHGILQGRILGGLPRPPPRDLLNPGIEPVSLTSPASAGGFFTTHPTWEARGLVHVVLIARNAAPSPVLLGKLASQVQLRYHLPYKVLPIPKLPLSSWNSSVSSFIVFIFYGIRDHHWTHWLNLDLICVIFGLNTAC